LFIADTEAVLASRTLSRQDFLKHSGHVAEPT